MFGACRRLSGPLLGAIRSLYSRCKSLVCLADNKSNSFLVGVTLPRLHFVTDSVHDLMDRSSRCSQVKEGFCLCGLRISSLLFLDDVVLLALAGGGLHLTPQQFTAKCEAAAPHSA